MPLRIAHQQKILCQWCWRRVNMQHSRRGVLIVLGSYVLEPVMIGFESGPLPWP
jgi:hypothetical protein